MASVIGSDSLSSIFAAMVDTTNRQSASNTALNNGLTFYQNGKYQQAVNSFRMAISYNADNGTGNNKTAYNYLAKAYAALGKDKEAIAAYKQSLKLDNTQDDIHVALANIYIQDNQNDAAEKELKAAMNADPSNVVAPYTLGQLLTKEGKPQEAETYFRTTIKLSPEDGNAYYGLGLSLNEQGKSSDAIPVLQKAIELKSGFAAAIYELGNAYYKNGQKDQVEAQITALTNLDTTEATTYATDLENMVSQPKITAIDTSKSTLNTTLGAVPLLAIDTDFVQPDAAKEVSVTFLFDSEMDAGSVMDISNWSITKARGATINKDTGLYDNGAYRSTDTVVSPLPTRVMYDATTQEATIFFSIRQNSTSTGTIDTSRIVFSFNGTDSSGKTMDPSANQIDGFAGEGF
ncbi:tetratricopeptide repeat protein [Geobacter sp. FeAm09]|uniref:tetratricopeptide repeat protein n=1 Tax=Geobacter sp. FeAm09 TaxID=2597769 RepID=UPI0011ED4B93|nr:tetratricopeptide repeat protein [Geobacter sp. FeAm09]QEM68028.1 tetratricopeptide repeat protein [Geobacter sp. FeAm09]